MYQLSLSYPLYAVVPIVFGDKAFRRFMPGNSEDPKGKWNIGQLNMSLYDIQMCGFALYSKNQIIPIVVNPFFPNGE
jgi:hypothetical protein